MSYDIERFKWRGKARQATASELGLSQYTSAWPKTLVITGIGNVVGETMFYRKRTTAKWAMYESFGGRLIRVVVEEEEPRSRT